MHVGLPEDATCENGVGAMVRERWNVAAGINQESTLPLWVSRRD